MTRCALFDLDDTLYPPASGLMEALRVRFREEMVDRLGISLEMADTLRREYLRRYGSTTQGLARHHDIDIQDLLVAVHDLPVGAYVQRDRELRCLLDCIQSEKSVFTNAPRVYAERVLDALGIADRFCNVFAIESSGYRGKPDPLAYEGVVEELGADERDLIMLDDSRANLIPAVQRGWTTVWVNGSGESTGEDGVGYIVRNLWEIARVFGQIGILSDDHRDRWHGCLARCPLGQPSSMPAR